MTKKGAPSKLQSLSDPLFSAIPDDMLRVCSIGGTSQVMATYAKGSDTPSGNELVTGAD
jgi:hypothetical protein